jgi:hypothetical protein
VTWVPEERLSKTEPGLQVGSFFFFFLGCARAKDQRRAGLQCCLN